MPDIGIIINPNNLAGNPIVCKMFAGENVSAKFIVYSGEELNQVIYTGNVYTSNSAVSVDITDLFSELKSVAGVEVYRVSFNANGIDSHSMNFNVYGGGINDLLQRILTEKGKTVFNWKLQNYKSNFFLTNRTNSKLIFIPENEIQPLYYYSNRIVLTVKNGNDIIAEYDHSESTHDSLEMVDIAALRKQYFLSSGRLISEFQFYTSTHCCSVVITEAEKADMYFKFRNSWGVYEVIAINGNLIYSPEFSDQTNTISKYDEKVSRMVVLPIRKTAKNKFRVEFLNTTSLLIDALLSSDCKLMISGLEVLCRFTIKSDFIKDTDNNLSTIEVEIELIDTMFNFSDLSALSTIGRVFSKSYTTHFN